MFLPLRLATDIRTQLHRVSEKGPVNLAIEKKQHSPKSSFSITKQSRVTEKMSRQEQQITVPSEPDFGKLYKKGILAFTRKTHAANPGVQIDRNTMATLWCNTARDLHPNWQTTKYSTAQKDNFLRLVLLAVCVNLCPIFVAC